LRPPWDGKEKGRRGLEMGMRGDAGSGGASVGDKDSRKNLRREEWEEEGSGEKKKGKCITVGS